MLKWFLILSSISDDSLTSGSNVKTINLNQNYVNHETKNEIDTSYEIDDHHVSNTLDEKADDKVEITIN